MNYFIETHDTDGLLEVSADAFHALAVALKWTNGATQWDVVYTTQDGEAPAFLVLCETLT